MTVLYVKPSDIETTSTRKDLIRKFFRGKYRTYNDEQCTQLQCESGRFRSVTELYQIVLSRFPKTTFNAILRIIRDLIKEDANIAMIYCTQVNKVVLKYFDSATRTYMSNYSRSNYYDKKGEDDYSLSDYEQIINNL